VRYSLAKAREVGGIWKLYKALRTRNACKTCALGMGGQAGGMVNERGHFPEVCKKSIQAMVADMQRGIPEAFFRTTSIAALQSMTPLELEASGRLTTPLVYRAGENHYEPITWDDALAHIIDRLRGTTPNETFWYFSGRSSNEAGFLLQLFARLYGTNNVNNCSYYCHQASGVGLTSATGSGTATIVLEDIEHADLVFVIGGNPASNHPRLMTTLTRVRRRGGEVIVINPVVEQGLVRFRVPSDVRSMLFSSEIASLYVQPHIGGDLALLLGIAKRIDETGDVDRAFLADACDGWPELRASLAALDWDTVQRSAGVDRQVIFDVAERYARAKNVVFSWTMGITHHAHGVDNVQAIANLALMRGMVGRPNAGLLPIRGHSNVQGIGSVGVTPALKSAFFDALQQHFGIVLPTTPGLDTMGSMEAAAAGALKVGVCLGGNLYGSNPDAEFATAALGKLDMLVGLNTSLNTGHAHGLARETIILPVLARDEEPQATTQESMFNFVRLSDGGPRRHDGPRAETEVIASIAGGVLGRDVPGVDGPIDWNEMRSHDKIRRAIARVVPGYAAVGNIGQTHQEFQIAGRTFHEPRFATPSGRAQLHTHTIPPPTVSGEQLRLMTVRSEGQFNTVVYEEHDYYRGIERRDVVLMHPDDLSSRGLADDQRVVVASATGAMRGIHVRRFAEIKPGNVLMYYPEANVLVPRTTDPKSKTPAFKGIAVTVKAELRAADG
jgi:molybdopterin-dependent oxidoreductase alpha subunit